MSEVIVPDASVILKWVVPSETESDTAVALAIRDGSAAGDIRLMVPALWLYEVGNTLARRYPQAAAAALDLLVAFEMEEPEPTVAWRARALALTADYGVTFYDAAYHALALIHKAQFITADRKYYDKACRAGNVRMLSEYS